MHSLLSGRASEKFKEREKGNASDETEIKEGRVDVLETG